MFDLTHSWFENEGWENYRQMLLNSYPQRMLKKTLTMPLNKLTSHFPFITAAALRELTVHL
jgi:hypothetical protein